MISSTRPLPDKIVFFMAVFLMLVWSTSQAQQITFTDKESGGSVGIGLTGSTVKQGEIISEDLLKSFEKGVSKYDDVIQKLGKPTTVNSSRGMTIATYTSTRAGTKVDAIKYVPILGTLFGSTKMDASSQVITFMFDSSGILMYIQDSSVKGSGEDKGLLDRLKNTGVKIE